MHADNQKPSTFWDIVEEFTVGEVVVAISRTKEQLPRYSMRIGGRRGPWVPVELLTTDHLPSVTTAVAKAQDWIHAEQAVLLVRSTRLRRSRPRSWRHALPRTRPPASARRSSTPRTRRSARLRTRRDREIGAELWVV